MAPTSSPRRRRPTLWDVPTPEYSVPFPPPGLATPSSLPAPPAAHPPPQSPSSSVVRAPLPQERGPLAGIDVPALRSLLTAQLQPAALVPGVGAVGVAHDLGSPNHATRHARRLYVGNLPQGATDLSVGDFFNRALEFARGLLGQGKPVISVYMNLEKRFAFIELRSLPETAAALAMDGVLFSDMSLRMRRPNDYNEALCPPAAPPPGFDASMLGIVSTQVGDGPDKVFIGGIPYNLTEDEVKQILTAYGRLAAFNLIKDPQTGTSKGFAFFEYSDTSVVDAACQSLNGTVLNNKTLTVRRATQHGARPNGTPGGGVDAASLVRKVTRVVELTNVVTEGELVDDEEYGEVCEDTEEEAKKFGPLESVAVPRPKDGGKGVGKVYLVYEKEADAEKAFAAMNGRDFDGRTVSAVYVGEDVLKANGGHI